MTESAMPEHAPYEGVVVGDPVEIRLFEDEDVLVASCEFRGDTFGGKTTLVGSDLIDKLAIDELVEGLAVLVWNELLGTPVFREEDQKWVERVEARASWATVARRPQNGWVRDPVHAVAEEPARDAVAATVGDADVSELRLTQEEMASLTHGEIPDTLIERLLRARSTENLVESVERKLNELESAEGFDSDGLVRARQEIAEVRRRLASWP